MRRVPGAVVLAALAGAGCGGGDGDGGGGGDAGVNACDRCGPHTICVTRLCAPVFSAGTYTITIDSGRFPSTRSDGSPWDVDGPPDLYATAMLGATTLGAGAVVMDSVTPMWSSPLPTPVALTPSDSLRFDVYDEDGATDELVLSCTTGVSQIAVINGDTFRYGCLMEPSQASGWLGFSLTLQ